MNYNQSGSFVESKVFLIMFIFSLEKILIDYCLQICLFIVFPHNSFLIGTLSIIVNVYSFLVNIILLFVIFYRYCGKVFPEKPAGTIISLIIGSFVGMWIGGLTATFLLVMINYRGLDFVSSISFLVNRMPYNLVTSILFALAAMFSAWLVKKWDDMLLQAGFKEVEKPSEVLFVSVIYIVFGILSLCVLPLLSMSSVITNASTNLIITINLIVLCLIGGAIQLAIGFGLYNGKRWGWLAAFIVSLLAASFNITTLMVYGFFTSLTNILNLIVTVITVISLVLNVLVIGFLIPSRVRYYCKMVNPKKLMENIS